MCFCTTTLNLYFCFFPGISLTLQRFKGNYIRLGVIADALLSSHQGIISKGFKRHLDIAISEIK